MCVLTALSLNFQLGARLIPQQREGLNFAIAAGLNGLVSLIPPPPEVIRAIILDYICAMDPALPSDCGLMGCTPTGPLITLAHNAQGLLCSCGLKESLAKAKRSRCEGSGRGPLVEERALPLLYCRPLLLPRQRLSLCGPPPPGAALCSHCL